MIQRPEQRGREGRERKPRENINDNWEEKWERGKNGQVDAYMNRQKKRDE